MGKENFMIYSHIIIHYDEITLKGRNRPLFENALVANIKEFLKDIKYDKISKEGGKIVVDMNENTNRLGVLSLQSEARLQRSVEADMNVKQAEMEKIKEILKNIPGISNFYFAVSEEKDMDKINKKTVALLNLSNKIDEYKTFKIEARRSDKKFKLKSPEINDKVGEYVLNNTKLKVDVHNPDLEIVIDVGNKNCFIYFEKIKGISGLPVGTAWNLVSLISGGIDSPVASFMMMKRGARIIFVHFKNRTIRGAKDGVDKIKSLVEALNKFQRKSKLYIIHFDEFQEEIIVNIPSKNRMIIYRRFMLKTAEVIAEKENAMGIVMGDSLGQVASQTLENINAAYSAVNLPVFTPLIGTNKQETIDMAKKIGTYEISIIPYPDCCSLLAAKHPETKARLEEIINQEKNLKVDIAIKKILAQTKLQII